MAEENLSADDSADDGNGTADDEKKKKPVLMIVAGVVVLLLAGGGGAYFTGMIGSTPQNGPTGKVETPSVYFDMPEMVVNLASGRKRARYLKLKIALEADSQENIDALKPKLPRIQDMFQIYLREMRRSDLEGSAGVYRLKQELMRRINITIHPAEIRRVLFKEIIIQ